MFKFFTTAVKKQYFLKETQQAFNLPTSSNVDYLQDLITETEHDDFEITEAEDYLLPGW